MKKKVVILFSRLSDYMLNVFDYWTKNSDVELFVFRKSVDQKEAPFQFCNDYININLLNENEYDKLGLLNQVIEINPQMIICGGWSDKRYLNVVDHFYGRIPTVMTMDNQWYADLRQYLALLASRLFLVRKFTNIWVPGRPQREYALKLGFKSSQIIPGLYVANKNNFSREVINPERKFTRRFIFTGRYIEIKGLLELWQAFIELQEDETLKDWELLCIGTGPLFSEKINHPKVTHAGFVQPHDLKKYMADGGVFVLPSHVEPWGVVVHEFALAGFPLLVSHRVGAASAFIDETNGIVFESGNKEQLKTALTKISQYSVDKLLQMGDSSYQKALQINETNWIGSANNILNQAEIKS